MKSIAPALLRWYDRHGRKHLPWQIEPTPYRVWVSEIMLQQTQVDTVIPYFQRFMAAFPDLMALAGAAEDDVLAHWSGLGYYARARNLHKAAREVASTFDGQLPADQDELERLPGIGRSTAAAIMSLAFGQRATILDGNVKRVLARYHCVDGWPGHSAVNRRLWELAETHTPARDCARYTQAIMDLGATVCTRSRPDCPNCPLKKHCLAHQSGHPARWPGKRPARKKPEQARLFLLLENEQGALLMIRRPPAGIWGGLWSLPEIEPDTVSGRLSPTSDCSGLSAAIAARYGLVAEACTVWPEVRHSFTHFDLRLTPVHIRTKGHAAVKEIAEADTLWYKPSQSPPGGMPAPVTRLLQRFGSRHEST